MYQRLRTSARSLLHDRLGVEVHRVRPAPEPAPPAAPRPQKQSLAYEFDETFNEICDTAAARSGFATMTKTRMFNLVQAFDLTRQSAAAGLVAECGCFRGASSYVLNRYLQAETPEHRGEGFHVFDSFEGISPLAPEDRPDDPSIPWPRQAGLLTAPIDIVRSTLADFPEVSYHPGWIPETLTGAPEGPYRFVHLDLDMHDPTRDCLEFFHPLLAPGGAIVVDDFGIWRWPGVAVAVEAFCSKSSAPLLRLSSGQAVVLAGRGTA